MLGGTRIFFPISPVDQPCGKAEAKSLGHRDRSGHKSMRIPNLVPYSMVFMAAIAVTTLRTGAEERSALSPNLDLLITEIREAYPPYASYCGRHPGLCEMTGPAIIKYSEDIRQTLFFVNQIINQSVNCIFSDKDLYGQEEYWTLPVGRLGDCEDIALKKREELVKLGLPRGAMTMAIVHHRTTLASHAVLLVETTTGTWVLNSLTAGVTLWHEAPYNYEMRERPDGTWERYDQSSWTFE